MSKLLSVAKYEYKMQSRAWQKILCKRNSRKSRMALWKRAKSGEHSLDDHSPGSGPRYARRRRECRGTLPGILLPGEMVSLAGDPLREHQLQLAEYQVPVLAPGMPVLHDPL